MNEEKQVIHKRDIREAEKEVEEILDPRDEEIKLLKTENEELKTENVVLQMQKEDLLEDVEGYYRVLRHIFQSRGIED